MGKQWSGRLSLTSLAVLALLMLLVVLIRFYPYTYDFPTLPRITHTASGAAGDPLNIVLAGSQQQITQGFLKAGWLVPDPITPQTTARIADDSVAHLSYPTAPVSDLYVFGRAQDLAFEKPTSDVQNRGHIRLWKTETNAGSQPLWIGQTSYDHGIELSGTNHLPTHHIKPTVDLERNAVGTDLAATGLVVRESLVAFTAPIFVAYNGGGDYYESDGNLLAISFTHMPLSLTNSEGFVSDLKQSAFVVYDALLSTLPLALAAAAVGLALLLVVLWPALRWLVRRADPRRGGRTENVRDATHTGGT